MPPTSTSRPSRHSLTAPELYSLAFGLFLGLAIVKFGNPVILDQIIFAPTSFSEFWHDAWPLHWANWFLAIMVLVGAGLATALKPRWPATRWLWILPIIWFAWQILAAAHSPYRELTSVTIWQYVGCIACYFLGAFVISRGRGSQLLLIGVLVAFAFCLIRAVDQKLFEFPAEKQFLQESQRTAWTNVPPAMIEELRRDKVLIRTNDAEILNPAIMAKYEKGRVQGTLVYPNALAGIVLLLFPVALVTVWHITRNLPRRIVCIAATGLMAFLGLGGLFWSGSKSGWLIALAVGVFWLCRLNWPAKFKWTMVIVLLVGGLAVFGLRFQNYFAKGATSVGARFDYWHVAARVSLQHPVFGTGPGTFQRPYAALKKPDAEMARLVHNDYLEQFSDSGFIGGLSYLAWLALLFGTIGRRIWAKGDWFQFAILAGLLGWFTQGLIEFSLFVPALAWTAFTLAGWLLVRSANQVDKPQPAD